MDRPRNGRRGIPSPVISMAAAVAAVAVVAGVVACLVLRSRREAAVRERYHRRKRPGFPHLSLHEPTPRMDALVAAVFEAADSTGAGDGVTDGSDCYGGDYPEAGMDATDGVFRYDGGRSRISRACARRSRSRGRSVQRSGSLATTNRGSSVVFSHAELLSKRAPTRGLQHLVAECGGVLRRHVYWSDTLAIGGHAGLVASVRPDSSTSPPAPGGAGPATVTLSHMREAIEEALYLTSPAPSDYLLVVCEGVGAVLLNSSGASKELGCVAPSEMREGAREGRGSARLSASDGEGREATSRNLGRAFMGGLRPRALVLRMSPLPDFVRERITAARLEPIGRAAVGEGGAASGNGSRRAART